ncbi:hypothetical protein GCM10025867_13950 [Frondihabitans sucicola]|uniref:Integral membrane protein n=1 Tax=Frondihabitans sucicola TaxID=1268041 RepID=A0ABM8GL58_9MICO|nr:hypothetical protein GCM10025867_13950 [Frondihabitans sucicola]
MNRPVTVVFAALESLLVVGIGVGIPVVALTFLWAFQYGLQVDWLEFWRAGADVWLVGHGVDLTLTLSKSAAAATGITGAGAPIVLTIAALGFAVATVLLGARSGRRIAETRHRAIGSVSAIATFAVFSALVSVSARQPGAEPAPVQGIVLPTLVFAVPLLVAAEVNRRRRGADPDPVTGAILAAIDRIPVVGRAVVAVAVRAGLGIAVVVFAVAGLAVGLLLLTHYAQIITLYEGAHAGGLGGLALTLGQIALIPNAIAWATSWFVGPGFALGTGSSVSPLGTTIGPMPAVPFLGALPTSELAFGFVGILVPVVATFVVVTLFRASIERQLGSDDTLVVRIVAGAATGVVAGLALGIVAGFSAGSAGPGRLASVGPNGLVVGAFAALEVAVPAILALVVRQPDVSLGDLTSAVGDRLSSRGDGVAVGRNGASTSSPSNKPSDERPNERPSTEPSNEPSSARSVPNGSDRDPASDDARATDVLPRLDEVLDGRGAKPRSPSRGTPGSPATPTPSRPNGSTASRAEHSVRWARQNRRAGPVPTRRSAGGRTVGLPSAEARRAHLRRRLEPSSPPRGRARRGVPRSRGGHRRRPRGRRVRARGGLWHPHVLGAVHEFLRP